MPLTAHLPDLVGHASWVPVNITLEEAFYRFTRHAHAFIAVLEEDGCPAGLCSRQDLGMLLGSRYGFPLFARNPIRDHLRPSPLRNAIDSDIRDAFDQVFARPAETFHDDVLLLGARGEFLGLIATRTMVKLQHRFHGESIRLLREQGRELAFKNHQIEADLRLSRELQLAMLTEACPAFPLRSNMAGSAIHFHHEYLTLDIVGGDFFHVQRVSELCAGVFIADVMGHGVRSALITAMLRALLEQLGARALEPGQVLAELNRELASILNTGDHDLVYATACYMIIDVGRQTLTFASAGHPAPVLIRRTDALVTPLAHDQAGTILGILGDQAFAPAETHVIAGDTILLMTDGLFEVENAAGEAFGLQRVVETLRQSLHIPTADLIAGLKQEALSFSSHQRFTDDVCLLAIDILPVQQAM